MSTILLFQMVAFAADTQQYLREPMPAQWTYTSGFSQTVPTEDMWWKTFGDPVLDSIISVGVKNNYNVKMVAHRMEAARSAIGATRSGYYPQLGVSAGWIKTRNSGAIQSTPNVPATTMDYYDLGVNMSWQIDLFGKITKQVEASKMQWEASKSQYEGAMVALCGNIATAYIKLRLYQTEYDVAIKHLESQRVVTEITEARFKAGLASKLDVSQAKMVLYSTEASIPSLKSSIENSINAIAILLGEYPSALRQSLLESKGLMDYRQMVEVGVPAELLRRRPDVRAAEYEVASAAAKLGISKKEFLPTLEITGAIGFQSHELDGMFKKNSFNYSVMPKLSWTLFSGLNRKYGIASAKEELMAQIDNYNLTVMTAWQDVEASMSSYRYSLQSIDANKKAMNQASIALELSLDLYKKGLSQFTNVMESMMSYLSYNNSYVVAQSNALLSLVNLYEALGGGWISNGK